MALIQLGTIVTAIRGKIAGTVFSNSHAGAVMRNKNTPTHIKSVEQQRVKKQWQLLSDSWRLLSPTDRAAWSNYATNFHFTNKLGQPVPARGNMVYNITNLYQYEVTGTLLTLPDPFNTPPLFDDVNVDIRHGAHYAAINWNYIFSPSYVTLFCSRPFSFGNNQQMQSRITKIYPLQFVDFANPLIDFSYEFWHKYPWARTGQYVWVAWRVVDNTCFSWTPFEYNLAIITH